MRYLRKLNFLTTWLTVSLAVSCSCWAESGWSVRAPGAVTPKKTTANAKINARVLVVPTTSTVRQQSAGGFGFIDKDTSTTDAAALGGRVGRDAYR